MPVKPENRDRYPANWKQISLEAKERAGWRCQHEDCGAHQYAVGRWRLVAGLWRWQPAEGRAGCGRDAHGHRWTWAEAQQYAAELDWSGAEEGTKLIVIVLTVAHLKNPDPADCRPENLAALCQRHHLALDAPMHRENAWRTRRAKSGTAELF
jgi:hypothetical protein